MYNVLDLRSSDKDTANCHGITLGIPDQNVETADLSKYGTFEQELGRVFNSG
jgi:hypothetical protein